MVSRLEFIGLVTRSLVRDEIDPRDMASWLRRGTKRINEELRVAEMVRSASIPLTGSVAPLPDDFLKSIDFRLVPVTGGGGSGPLIYTTPADMSLRKAYTDVPGAVPGYYTVNGASIEVTPWSIANNTNRIALSYFGKMPDLGADDTATNLLTEKFEDLFLNAVLIYGHRHYFEDDRSLLKDGLVQQEIARLNLVYEEAKHGDGPLVMRPARKIGGRFS